MKYYYNLNLLLYTIIYFVLIYYDIFLWWINNLPSALHLNLPDSMNKSERDVQRQMQVCLFSLFFGLPSFSSFIISHVIHGICTQGLRILSPILCQLSYRASLLFGVKWNMWSWNHNYLCKWLQVLTVLPPLVLISVGNCSDMYLLARISHLAKKVPTGTFSSWDEGYWKAKFLLIICILFIYFILYAIQEHNIYI